MYSFLLGYSSNCLLVCAYTSFGSTVDGAKEKTTMITTHSLKPSMDGLVETDVQPIRKISEFFESCNANNLLKLLSERNEMIV